VTEAQARELISATFAAAWPTVSGDAPFALDNEVLPSSDTFALCTVMLTTSGTTTQGAPRTRRERTTGWIQVKLWTPAGVGVTRSQDDIAAGVTPRATELAEAVKAIFRLKDLPAPVAGQEPLRTGSPVTLTIGTDGRWFLQLVRTPFWYVETV
jgi:hypothetical protein